MSATFYYTRDTQRGTESIVVSGSVVRTVPSSHPNFPRIRDYCLDKDKAGLDIDMDEVLTLCDAEKYIADQLLLITDRVSFKNNQLLWDGEPTESALASHIVRMINNKDGNYVAFARFLENLSQNPSADSRAALFEWIADRNFTVTEDGCFIGYKGVTAEYKSKHAGYGIVNGVEQDGYLDNTPGNVVEVPRNKVDADRDSACSYGLHVGTRSYATSYAYSGKMVIVAVNPRDVVMVPRDGDGQKMRCCKYTVLSDNDQELTTTTYNGRHAVDEDESSVYDEHCEGCGCLLNEDGECVCDTCNDEAEVEERFECECGEEVDNEGDLCPDCEADEEAQSAECKFCGATLGPDGTCPSF